MLGGLKMGIKKVFLTSAVVASSLLLGAEKQEFNYTEWQHRLWEEKPYRKLQA